MDLAGVWRFDTGQLLRDLSLIAEFPQGSPLLFFLGYEEDMDGTPFLKVYATDKDYVFEDYIPLVGDSICRSDKIFFLQHVPLLTLARTYPSFELLLGTAGELVFHSDVVRYELRQFASVSPVFPEVAYSTEPHPFVVPQKVLQSAKKVMDFSTKIVDNKIGWNGEQLRGSFLIFSFDFRFNNVAKLDEPIYFRRTDLSLLNSIAASSPGETTEFSVSPHRFVFYFGNASLSFLRVTSTSKMTPVVTKERYGVVSFDVPLLQKVLTFSRVEESVVSLTFVPDGQKVYAKFGRSGKFLVGDGEIPQHGFSLQLDSLRKVISVLPSGLSKVDCNIHGDGAVFPVTIDGVTCLFAIGKIDTTQTSNSSMEVIDRLKPSKTS